MYDKDSSQGKVIVAAQKRAAASAAQSNSFSAGSSALNTADATPILNNIADDVEIIRNSVNQLVVIAEADARGDALGSANVTEDATVTAMTGDGGTNVVSDAESAEKAGGLGGLAGMIGGLGMGMQFWGTKKAVIGVPVFLAFLLGLIGVGYVGAKAFRASVEDIAEGMEHLSDADVDTDKVIAMGEALAKFGLAMGAEGLGAGIGSLGNLVSGIADGFAGFLGIEKKDPMVALKAFSQHKISEDEVKQIVLNAKALTAFSGAMTVSAGADFATSVANLATGVIGFVTNFFPKQEDPMLKMIKFAEHKITQDQVDQIKLNAAALLGFSTVMATVKTINIAENLADLASGIVNFASSFFPEGKDPMIEMKKFAGTKLTQVEVDQIMLNSKALLAFAPTMAIAKATGAAADIASMFGGIANAVGSFFGFDEKDPMLDMKKFVEHKFTEDEVKQIELNANALVNFSKAMALYKASGAAADSLQLVGNMAKGISNFFGGETSIDYEEIKTFANSGLDTLEPKITANAKTLGAFSLAMQTAASDSADIAWTNIGTNILGAVGSIFGGKAEDKIDYEDVKAFAALGFDETTEANIVQNAKSVHAFTSAVAKMSSLKQGEGFWDSIGNTLSGAFSALMGQDTLPIAQITEFTKTELDLARVNNNISAIEAFMNFGTRMKDWTGSSMGGLEDLGRNMTAAAQGIYIAMYGGKNTEGNNYELDASMSLSQLDLGDMQTAAKGIAVLRTSMIAAEPVKALKEASAVMNTATGGLTVVNAPQTTTTSNVQQGDTVVQELGVVDMNQMYMQDAFMSSMPSLR